MPRSGDRGIRSDQLNNVAVTDLGTLLTNHAGHCLNDQTQLQPLVLPHPSHKKHEPAGLIWVPQVMQRSPRPSSG